jgi:hypothetical protein
VTEPLNDSVELLDLAADVLDHDDALRIVRRLKLRFPCMGHERCFCPEPFGVDDG